MVETIGLPQVLKTLKKRLLLIISIVLISSGGAAYFSYFLIEPQYEAETQILVNRQTSDQELFMYLLESDLQLIHTYSDIIKSPTILNIVIEELGLNVSVEQLSEQISLSNEEKSKVVKINVLDHSPARAADIANKVAEVIQEEIPKLLSVNNISILSVAKYSDNQKPVKPNKLLNIVIGIVIGFMLGIGLAVLLDILDTKIENEQDLEGIALPIIGVVSSISQKELDLTILSRKKRGK